jgi:hypothetical protein
MKKSIVLLILVILLVLLSGNLRSKEIYQDIEKNEIEIILEKHNPSDIWLGSEKILVFPEDDGMVYKNMPILYALEKMQPGGIDFLKDMTRLNLQFFVMKTLKYEYRTNFHNLKVKNYKYNKFIYSIAKIPIYSLISINKRNFTTLSQGEILEILEKEIYYKKTELKNIIF